MSLADGSRTCQKYWISKGGLWSLSDASQWSKETRLPFSVVKEDTEAFRMPSQWSKETQLPFSVVKEDTEAFRMPSQWSKETRKPFYDTLGLSYALLKNSA